MSKTKQIFIGLSLLAIFSISTFSQKSQKVDFAKKIQEATSHPLPQSPIVKKLKTDAEDNRLKGKVKSVSESEEDLTGTWSVKGIKMSFEEFYDENSNKIKSILYDNDGNPFEVDLYGFIDGMRVSQYKQIGDELPTRLQAVATTNRKEPTVKPADTRYDTKYEYKYDDKGRLEKELRSRNNGEMYSKIVYSYDGNKLTETVFDINGQITYKAIELYDDKSNLTLRTIVHQAANYPDSIDTFTYESFDEKGNWTKRTIVETEGGVKKQNYVKYRTITYYP